MYILRRDAHAKKSEYTLWTISREQNKLTQVQIYVM